MPEIEIEPTNYRIAAPPKASRLNAILVLCTCLLVSPILVIFALRDELMATVIVISVVVGIAGGWAITRIGDPKPYIAEDDPTQLKNPAPKTWLGRLTKRPAGWDARSAWTARLGSAIVMGLIFWWVRSHH